MQNPVEAIRYMFMARNKGKNKFNCYTLDNVFFTRHVQVVENNIKMQDKFQSLPTRINKIRRFENALRRILN